MSECINCMSKPCECPGLQHLRKRKARAVRVEVTRAEWLRMKRIERAAKKAVRDLTYGLGEDPPPFVIVRLREALK